MNLNDPGFFRPVLAISPASQASEKYLRDALDTGISSDWQEIKLWPEPLGSRHYFARIDVLVVMIARAWQARTTLDVNPLDSREHSYMHTLLLAQIGELFEDLALDAPYIEMILLIYEEVTAARSTLLTVEPGAKQTLTEQTLEHWKVLAQRLNKLSEYDSILEDIYKP
jgi:hypothetical protein